VAPPSWDSYRPTVGALGGVKRPPLTAEAPCRAHGCTDEDVLAIPRVHRDPRDRAVVGHGKASPDQATRSGRRSVDLYRPRAASESLEPFPSPVPTYKVWPDESVGSISSEPMAVVGMPLLTLVHVGVDAMASAVTQTPPPAAPTKQATVARHASMRYRERGDPARGDRLAPGERQRCGFDGVNGPSSVQLAVCCDGAFCSTSNAAAARRC